MARRRYYRYPRRTVAKKKWASNLTRVKLGDGNAIWATLVENKAQANAPTPTIIKTGNFKIQGDCIINEPGQDGTSPSNFSILVYILFVPEGWLPDLISGIPVSHPEWIMGWTFVDAGYIQSFSSSGTNKFSITSRLKRNLNSGDKVVLYSQETGTETRISTINAVAQYWTCAN